MMNSELKLPSHVDTIYQSIEEAHALIFALEEGIKLGLITVQPETAIVELTKSEERPLIIEDSAFLLD